MNLLTRQQILDADDRPFEDVPVPEWGGSVRVRRFSARERDAFELSLLSGNGDGEGKDLRDIRTKLAIRVLVDDKGEPLFTAQDLDKLAAKSGAAMDRVFDVAQRLNRLSTKDMEELAGKSPAREGQN